MLNGLKQKFICAVLKNSVPTSQKTVSSLQRPIG